MKAYQFEDIQDQVVIITGSGRGIGKATAELFAQHGARVVVSDIDKDVCDEAVEGIKAMGAQAIGVVTDITKKDETAALMKAAVDQWGQIDCLVNNAGITQDTLFLRMKEDIWHRAIDINLTGTYRACWEAVQYMRKTKKGTIINFSSIARTGNPGQANYSAAKAGVVGLTQTLAKELASMGIRVNCVAPGLVETRMTNVIPDKIRAQLLSLIPFKRAGQPSEIAYPVLFLASKMSSYVNGVVLEISGGISGL